MFFCTYLSGDQEIVSEKQGSSLGIEWWSMAWLLELLAI